MFHKNPSFRPFYVGGKKEVREEYIGVVLESCPMLFRLEWLRLGRRDGLDDAQELLGISHIFRLTWQVSLTYTGSPSWMFSFSMPPAAD